MDHVRKEDLKEGARGSGSVWSGRNRSNTS